MGREGALIGRIRDGVLRGCLSCDERVRWVLG